MNYLRNTSLCLCVCVQYSFRFWKNSFRFMKLRKTFCPLMSRQLVKCSTFSYIKLSLRTCIEGTEIVYIKRYSRKINILFCDWFAESEKSPGIMTCLFMFNQLGW